MTISIEATTSFPKSMIKFTYFYVRNNCKIEFLSWGNTCGQILWDLCGKISFMVVRVINGPKSEVFSIV